MDCSAPSPSTHPSSGPAVPSPVATGARTGSPASCPSGARTRIEGSRGIPEREWNGPVVGLQERYLAGLAALGTDFALLAPEEQDARLDAIPEFGALLHEHACEGTYGDPVYRGNREGAGWRAIGFPGDVQPRGWRADEVAGRG
jgi:hypothetical protein